ncbi:tandem-95 repeat protein, partial [Reichenbachiella sp. 5M10]|uniref:tandem-95 repeat protein n=1 Tax=Reichenbachiella sp. 5M10 TaxID=1889772 RepID=UPI00117A78FB
SVPAATDVDGTVVSYALVDDTTKGNLTFNGDGTYSFDPNGEFEALAAGATEDVTFTYTATDNDGVTSSTQTVTITVTGTNDAPVASNDAQGTDEETTLSTSVPAATDVDGTVVSYALVDDTTKGNLTFNGDGTYSFDPNGEFEALATGATEDVTFTYTATDNDGTVSGTQTVTITVTGTNDAPVASNDAQGTDEETTLSTSVPAATD